MKSLDHTLRSPCGYEQEHFHSCGEHSITLTKYHRDDLKHDFTPWDLRTLSRDEANDRIKRKVGHGWSTAA